MSTSQKSDVESVVGLIIPDRPYEDRELEDVSLRPTLVIGLGGTGEQVVFKCKERLQAYFRDQQNFFQFLVVDTDQASANRLAADEFVYVGGFDGDALVHELRNNHPDHPILDWWPKDYLIGQRVDHGAKQVRAIGRLALFYQVNKLWDALNTKMTTATSVEQQMRPGAPPVAKVYVVCSLAGGSGSGMFLDTAYLARKAVQQAGRSPYVTGVLVFPRAFESVLRGKGDEIERTRTNAYAALKELEFFSRPNEWRCRYTRRLRIKEENRPFDICYLLDSLNEEAAQLQDNNRLTEMMAEQIFLEIATPMGANGASQFDNVASTHGELNGRPTAFSSFGVASLVHPVRNLVGYAARMAVAQLLARLSGPGDPEKVQDQVAKYIEFQELCETDRDDLLNSLVAGNAFEWYSSNEQFSSFGAEEARDEAQRQKNDVRTQCEEYEQQVVARGETRAEGTIAALDDRLRDFVNSPDGGVGAGLRFLEKLKGSLQAYQGEMEAEETDESRQLEDEEENCTRAVKQMNEVLQHYSYFFPKSRMTSAVSDFIGAVNEYAHHHVEAKKREVARSVYTKLLGAIEEHEKQLSELATNLARTAQNLRRDAETVLLRSGRTTDRGKRYLLSECLLDYDQSAKTGQQLLEHFSDFAGGYQADCGDPWGWKGEKLDALLRRLYDTAWRFFTDLAKEDLLEQAKAIDLDDDEVGQKLLTVFARCAPFWNFLKHRVVGLGEPPLISLAGVDDRDRHEWQKIKPRIDQQLSFVTTKNPQEVVFTRSRHGLPLVALTVLQTLKDTYEQAEADASRSSNPRPLHLHPDYARLPDLFMDAGQDDDTLQIFALGVIYELIYHKRNFYYAKAMRQENEDYVLGNGRAKAVDEFRKNRRAVVDVTDQLRGQIQREGADATGAQIQEYLEKKLAVQLKRATSDELKKLLRREYELIENYVEENLSNRP